MSGDEPIRSRLTERAGPIRGLGAGNPANQRLAGVADPETAARLAAADPAAYQEEMERAAKYAADLKERKEELLAAITEGRWAPEQALPAGSNWALVLERQPAQIVNQWHEEYQKALNEDLEAAEEEKLKSTIRQDFQLQPEDHLYDPMMDKDRRARIEKDLKPLDFESMLFQGYVEQAVPVRESLTITFRTLNTTHGLWLEHFMSSPAYEETNAQALRHTYTLFRLAICLEQINGKAIEPSIEKLMKDSQREDFYTAMKLRMEKVSRYPSLLTDDLIIQMAWFDGRVRRMLTGNLVEKVGNS